MAHQSGYGGSVTAGSGNAPAAIAIGLEAWNLDIATESHEARSKGEAWKTKFAGASEWTARITCLVQDDATDGLVFTTSGTIIKRTVTDLLLKVNANDYITGTGFVDAVAVESPVDGPAKATYGIIGTGALAETFA